MNIVVTGASKGIGRAIVERFAREGNAGHTFILNARTASALDRTIAELTAAYPAHRFIGHPCDMSDEHQVEAFAAHCSDLGTTDILIHNAGFGIFKPVTDISLAEFRSVLDTNLRGVFLLTRALLPPMRAAKRGTIVAIASLAGKAGFAGGTAYCASKFGVRGFMQNLFLEIRTDNIRCVTICPGSVDTEFFAHIDNPGSTTKMLTASDVAEAVWAAAQLPAGATVSELEIRPTNPKG